MPMTPTITFRGIHPSPALELAIRRHAVKLERYGGPVISCRVLVEKVGRRRESGNPIRVAIDLAVPTAEIVISHEAAMHAEVAIREAFDTARRRLQDRARLQRGDVKRHLAGPEARPMPAAKTR